MPALGLGGDTDLMLTWYLFLPPIGRERVGPSPQDHAVPGDCDPRAAGRVWDDGWLGEGLGVGA